MFIMKCIIAGKDFTSFMSIFKLIITVVQYAVPVALILWGSIDLFKSITTGKEDEIKKKQTLLIKKVLSAVIIFLLPWLIFTLLSILGGSVGKFGNCYKKSPAGFPDLNNNEIYSS